MEKWLPCPFCGSLADGVEEKQNGYYAMKYRKCYTYRPQALTIELVIQRWN